MRTICFLSTTRKQHDSIWWFEWVAQVLFACVKERAHALVTLPGSTEPKLFKGNKKKGIMLTGVGLKPSWKPGNRSGEDRSTEMSLNIQNKLCQKSKEELQSSKKEAVQYSPRWISVICFSAQLLQTVYEILQKTHNDVKNKILPCSSLWAHTQMWHTLQVMHYKLIKPLFIPLAHVQWPMTVHCTQQTANFGGKWSKTNDTYYVIWHCLVLTFSRKNK